MIKEYFSIALRSIITHKARAFLTMLGVIIGVTSVILLISLGQSVKTEAANEIRGLGSNLVLVSVTDPQGYLPKIWLDELKDSAKIKEYSPVVQGNTDYKVNGEDFSVQINGVNQKYSYIAALNLDAGRFFSGIDSENNNAVAVIGKKVANTLFQDQSPIGKYIVVKGIAFKIIGSLKGRGTNFNGDMDKIVYIPSGFAATLFPQGPNKVYYVASEEESYADMTKNKIESYLRRVIPSDKNFIVFSQSQMIDFLNQIMSLLTSMLAGIAAISLLVGGIGIMNIMLVTVRERTKEIGIRKALGARRFYIMMQFLTEAVIITMIGGLLGLGFSAIAAKVIEGLVGFPINTGLDSVLLSILFSTVVGIVFGLYPASKASKLAPVEALRFE